MSTVFHDYGRPTKQRLASRAQLWARAPVTPAFVLGVRKEGERVRFKPRITTQTLRSWTTAFLEKRGSGSSDQMAIQSCLK